MEENKKSESGSMMIEIIAVLGIMGIMTPIVYQQALKRNIEVSNINMADEMRTVKDGIKAYLDANIDQIIAGCNPTCVKDCTEHVNFTDMYDFALKATDYTFGKEYDVDNDYVVRVYAYNNPITVNGETVQSQGAFAIISSTSQPILKKKRAMKIASLVGAAGGICTTTADITGSYGAWSLKEGEETSCDVNISGVDEVCWDTDGYTVVARTDM